MNHTSKLPLTLLPKVPGLRLEDTFIDADTVSLTLASTSLPVACPVCGHATARLHSHYRRTVADLPWSGRHVRLLLSVPVQMLNDRMPAPDLHRTPAFSEPYARKTARLHEILKLVGFALSGEAGARLIQRLGMVASPTTLLRYVRGAATAAHPAPRRSASTTSPCCAAGATGRSSWTSRRHRPIEAFARPLRRTLSAWLKSIRPSGS